MNRRSFFKTVGALSAAIAMPIEPLAAILPKQWSISPVRWTKAYDLHWDSWIFRADCFIGKAVDETPTKITLENPLQLCVDVRAAAEELSAHEKEVALEVLMNEARHRLATMEHAIH